MEVVLIVAIAENGVIGSDGAIPWRLKSDMKRFKALTMNKPVVMGRKTFLSIGGRYPGAPISSSPAIPIFAAAGVIVTHSFADARAIALGDALRRFATEIAIIGGAEIYAQWMDDRRPAGNHRSTCPARGRHAFRRNRRQDVGRGVARAKSGRRGR